MSELGKQLDLLSNLRNSDEFVIPDNNSKGIRPVSKPNIHTTSKKNKKKKTIDDVLDETDTFIDSLKDKDFDYDFEDYIDDALTFEEDEELKTNLIGMGRKYARTHMDDKEESEINKAFAPQEKELNTLITELNKDAAAIENDINKMRMSHQGVNRKNLADMITAKNQIHNTRLSAIKEKSNIKKIKFDIITKKNANKKDDDGEGMSIQNAHLLQSLLNNAGLVESVGGRENMSGAPVYDDGDPNDVLNSMENNDEFIRKKYFNKDVDEETESDKYIKYENEDVHYVLLIDEEKNPSKIIAETKNGDILSDYPVPSNVNELNFIIEPDSQQATDQLNRQYQVRYI